MTRERGIVTAGLLFGIARRFKLVKNIGPSWDFAEVSLYYFR
jgi:hypothetical protein